MVNDYIVIGMHCDNCARKIRNKLQSLQNINNLKIDVAENTLTFESQDTPNLELLNQSLAELGEGYRLVSAPKDRKKNPFAKLKTFLPLITIFSLILIITFASQIYNRHFHPHDAMRVYMATFFIIFSFLKLINLKGFAGAFKNYDFLAQRSSHYALIYPFLELGLGLMFLFNTQLFLANIYTIVLMGVGNLGVLNALRSGKEIQCACVGTFFKLPMTKVTLIENTVMIVMAIGSLLVLI